MKDLNTDAWTDRLSEYLDGDLATGERDALEQHLDGCERCRRVLASLQSVVAHARAVEDVPPARDLWSGIAERIQHSALPRHVSFSIPQLVAASFFVALISGLATLAMFSGRVVTEQAAVPPPAAPAVSVALDDPTSDRAATQLLDVLNESRASLDPRTVEVVERSIATIDRAILEARTALAADPGNAYLSRHLARERQLKLAVLRRVTTLAEVRQ